MHLLLRLLNNTKYTGTVHHIPSTRNDDLILKIQEPVGYFFFLHDNVDAIIQRLSGYCKGHDVIEYMLTVFYKHGSVKSGVNVSDDDEAKAISDQLSTKTVNDLTRKYADDTFLHDDYRGVIRKPNRVGPLPFDTNSRVGGRMYKRYNENG